MTFCWWQLIDVGVRISILVSSLEYWCPMLTLKDRACWWQKRRKPSPTSQSCRHNTFRFQHPSPTSMKPLVSVVRDEKCLAPFCHQNPLSVHGFCKNGCGLEQIVWSDFSVRGSLTPKSFWKSSHALLAFDKFIGTAILDLSYTSPNPNSMSFWYFDIFAPINWHKNWLQIKNKILRSCVGN